MIISPIELCNTLVPDSEGAAPSFQYPPPPKKKTTNLGFYMLQKTPFQALDLDIFLEEHDPSKAHKRMIVLAVVCIINYSKQIGFNC